MLFRTRRRTKEPPPSLSHTQRSMHRTRKKTVYSYDESGKIHLPKKLFVCLPSLKMRGEKSFSVSLFSEWCCRVFIRVRSAFACQQIERDRGSDIFFWGKNWPRMLSSVQTPPGISRILLSPSSFFFLHVRSLFPRSVLSFWSPTLSVVALFPPQPSLLRSS